jgi:predicted secreted protein
MEMMLTAADTGRTVEVARDAWLALRLDENRSTGYTWTIETAPTGCLRREMDGYQPRTSLPGAPGIRLMLFTLHLGQGRCSLDVILRRPWEPPSQAAERLTYTVVAKRRAS